MRSPNGEKMGAVYVKVRLSNAGDVERVRRGIATMDEVRSCEVEALVDTGATRSAIPKELVERLGLAVMSHAAGTLADGTNIKIGFSSPIAFEILGREAFEGAYIMGDEVLIGQTILEETDLLVDCRNQRVTGKHAEGPLHRL
jgi:clan AA aspartic protease